MDTNDEKPSALDASQAVLTNYDLLTTIFQSVNPCHRSWWFRFALVCKAFKGPALDCLWAQLDSFIPLLKLLPRLEEFESVIYFHGDIAQSHFREYSVRVREINISISKEKSTFSGQALTRLAKQLARRSMLPGLRRLRIDDLDAFSCSLLPLIYSSAVDTLEIGAGSLSRTCLPRSLFPSLNTDLPGLRKLAIQNPSLSFQIEPSILETILDINTLRSLDLQLPATLFHPEYVVQIGTKLPHLVHLSLDIGYRHESSTVSHNGTRISNIICPTPPTTEKLFSSLQTLHLTLRDGNTCHVNASVRFCAVFTPDFLAHLTSVTLYVSSPLTSLSDFVQCLSRAPVFERLELTQTTQQQSVAVPLAALLPALTLPTIKEVIIDVGQLSFANAEEGQNWVQQLVDVGYSSEASKRTAKVRTLALPSTSSYPASIQSLKYVALHAIGLERLSLAVNSSLESLKDGSVLEHLDMIPTSTIRHLDISDVRANKDFTLMEHSNIAQFIDRIFPNLEFIQPYRDSRGVGGAHVENWEFIEHLRKEARALRIFKHL